MNLWVGGMLFAGDDTGGIAPGNGMFPLISVQTLSTQYRRSVGDEHEQPTALELVVTLGGDS